MFLFHPCFMMVQCDTWCSVDPFLQCSFFLTDFSKVLSGCSFEVCRSALMSLVTFASSQFHSAGKVVRFGCVFVCVSLPVCFDLPLYTGTCVAVFNPFQSAACLSSMWFCRFQPCRSLSSLMEKFLARSLFL